LHADLVAVDLRAVGIRAAAADVAGLDDRGQETATSRDVGCAGVGQWATCSHRGRRNRIVQRRAEKLGIERVYTGVNDKLGRAEELCAELGISLEETAFIGDGIGDLSLLRRVGFAATVPDAPRYIREVAHYVTGTRGGHGAFREFVTQILGRAGTLEKARERVVKELAGGAGAE